MTTRPRRDSTSSLAAAMQVKAQKDSIGASSKVIFEEFFFNFSYKFRNFRPRKAKNRSFEWTETKKRNLRPKNWSIRLRKWRVRIRKSQFQVRFRLRQLLRKVPIRTIRVRMRKKSEGEGQLLKKSLRIREKGQKKNRFQISKMMIKMFNIYPTKLR